MSDALLKVENLRKVFTPRGRDPVVAVNDVSFSVSAGEVLGLLGPNGAGKTTLLRMMTTLLTPTSGSCWIAGRSVAEAPDDLRRHIGFLSGNTKLYGRLTAREILRYFGQLYDMDDEAISARTEELATAFDMGEFLDRPCGEFSTGQKQKLSIARVLLHSPEVLVLDEPTLGLDIFTSETVLQFIAQAREENRCVVFSTHQMGDAELLCTRVALIHRGSFLAVGSIEEIYEQTGCDNLHAAFMAAVEKSDGQASDWRASDRQASDKQASDKQARDKQAADDEGEAKAVASKDRVGGKK